MDLFYGILLVGGIHFLAAILPGADFAYTTSVSISNGKRAGLLTCVGITLGLSIHIIYSIFGLALVISNSVFLLNIIKNIGGIYLIYLGISSFFAKNKSIKNQKLQPKSAKTYILKGILCNALNPKAPIYFVSVFTTILSPSLDFSHLVIYGFVMMAVQLFVFSSLVMLLTTKKIRAFFEKFNSLINKTLGVFLTLLGFKVLFSR